MKNRIISLLMAVAPLVSMAQDGGGTVSKWWSRMSVEVNVGVMYTNDLWPYTEKEGEMYSYGFNVVEREFGTEGRNCSIKLGYDLSEKWTLGLGASTRRRGLFVWEPAWGGSYVNPIAMNNMKWLVHRWDGAVLNLPVTIEYHQKWFYVGCGMVVERGIPLHGGNDLLPPPYGRSGSTVMKWWHGGAVVSFGGRFQLSRHSTIKVGFEACVVVTPYAYYAEDWIGVMPSDRHYHLYANRNYGVTVGYVYHL